MASRFISAVESLFRFQKDDVGALARDLFSRSRRTYEAVVNAQLESLGHAPAFHLTNRDELTRLRTQANETARGIARTYNESLARQVDEIVEREGKRGLNRTTLGRRLLDWEKERKDWKDTQLAITESGRVANQALLTWVTASGLETTARFRLLPADSSHDDLNDQAARAGRLLRGDDPALLELPAHPNERHSAVLCLPEGGADLGAVWLGE